MSVDGFDGWVSAGCKPDVVTPFTQAAIAYRADRDRRMPFEQGSARPAMIAPEPQRSSVFFSAAELEGQPIPARQWLVDGLIPSGTVSLLGGDGGTGKSLLALQLAVAVATGGAWLGLPVTSGRAIYISAEDDHDELHRRLSDITCAEGVTLADLDNLTVRSLAGEDALLAALDRSGGVLHA